MHWNGALQAWSNLSTVKPVCGSIDNTQLSRLCYTNFDKMKDRIHPKE
jgi:hypothetical protein